MYQADFIKMTNLMTNLVSLSSKLFAEQTLSCVGVQHDS